MENYHYKITKSKKLTDRITQLETVTIYNSKFEEVGKGIVWRGDNPQDVVKMIIRDIEIRKAWRDFKPLNHYN